MANPPETLIRFEERRVVLRIGRLDADQRLDRFLRKALPAATLGFIQKTIDRGRARVNGAKVRAGHRIAAGDELTLAFPQERWEQLTGQVQEEAARPARPPRMPRPPSGPPLVILHEDEWMLALDKPAGQDTHDGEESLVTAVRWRLRSAGGSVTFRPAPAHRLDKDTSGIVLFGKTPEAQRVLATAFRDRFVSKTYVAIAAGRTPDSGVLSHRLVRHDRAKGPKMTVAPSGKPAETEFARLAAGGGISVVELRPITGRTHQLRAQLAAAGHPILGDRRYFQAGSKSTAQRLGVDRLCLHAAALEFPHPEEGVTMRVEAPLPDLMVRIAAKAGFRPGSP